MIAAGNLAPIDGRSDVTLQINFSAGDAAYAALTVPALVNAHEGVARRLAIVDCCRPQRTRIFDPDSRVPEPAFRKRLGIIRKLVEEFRRGGLFDEVVYLEPKDPRFRNLASSYVRPWMTETHDYGGCAFMAYWAALDLPRTRFVLHYDADMLLHQDDGFSWVDAALALWPADMRAIFATPRISPPGFAASPAQDGPSSHEGRPARRVEGGWHNDWFSTRCFLADRSRLAPLLPLVRGRRTAVYWLRRLADRGYPPGPELLLFQSLGSRGWRCLHLGSPRAWLLHPTRKDAEYLRLLPRMIEAVAAGRVPQAQKGIADLRLEAWSSFGAGDPIP
jgi:hypothetical protein